LSALPFAFFIVKKVKLTIFLFFLAFILTILISFALGGYLHYENLFFIIPFLFTYNIFKESNVPTFSTLIVVSIPSLLYALFQFQYGYLQFELDWIKSGVGVVSEAGYFVTEDLRPFSTLAGTPELALLTSGLLYISLRKERYIYVMLFAFMLLLTGSRGMILSTFIAIAIDRLNISPRRKVLLGIFVGFIAYITIPAYYWISSYFSSVLEFSRLAVLGTYTHRVDIANEYLSNLNLFHIISPVSLESMTGERVMLDNLYLRLLNDFGGLFSLIIIFIVINFIKSRSTAFFAVLYFCYGYYAELQYAFYFNSLFFIFLYLFYYKEVNYGIAKCR
jgi:hypothetical protein